MLSGVPKTTIYKLDEKYIKELGKQCCLGTFRVPSAEHCKESCVVRFLSPLILSWYVLNDDPDKGVLVPRTELFNITSAEVHRFWTSAHTYLCIYTASCAVSKVTRAFFWVHL